MKNKRFTFDPSKAAFRVDPENKRLMDVVLLEGDREASGHGIFIDQKSLETALASIEEKGGVLKAYYTHNHRGAASSWWANMVEDSHSELFIPGYFTGIRVEDGKLIAGEFSFYDAFAAEHPYIVAQILEMAAKTPSLIMQSIEFWGYGVYVDKDGKEYQEAPEDTELQYNGLPAVRVVEMFASAFVADGAATSGLFHKLSRKLKGEDGMEQLRESLSAWKEEILSEFRKSEPQPPHEMNILEQIKDRYGADKSRLSRALMLHAENPDLAINEIDFRLKEEDRAAELDQLRKEKEELEKKALEADELKKAKEELEKRFNVLKESGQDPDNAPRTPSDHGPDPDGITFVNFAGRKSPAKGFTAKAAQAAAAEGRQLAITTIGDLWTPDIWIRGMPEMVSRQTSLLTSPVVVANNILNEIAAGGGTSGNIPNFREPDHDDEPQVAGTAPTVNNVGSGLQVAPILNRVSAVGSQALAGAVSASDPIGFAMGVTSRLRLRQRQRTLINILRGVFGTAFTALSEENFVEAVSSQTSDHLIDSDMIDDGIGRLGETKDKLTQGGYIMMHSDIEKALSKQDRITYIRDSEGRLLLREYRGLTVILNDGLVRAGTTDGLVYDTYIFAPASIGMGDKPQSNQVGQVASLLVDGEADKNDVTIYDRTRFLLHPFGAKWTGTPAGQSATNAELATAGNWALAYNDVKNVGVCRLVTNG